MKTVIFRFLRLFFCFLLFVPLLSFQIVSNMEFRKQMIAAESAESVGIFDVDGDGELDIVSGSFWYEGPLYQKHHFIGQRERVGEYFDDFSTIPLDVNGDERTDYVTGGWFNETLLWWENPGDDVEWPQHKIASPGNIETTRAWDIDGDGFKEIVPNTPGKALTFYTLLRDKNNNPIGRFTSTQVKKTHGHGLGFGDVNGDGFGDFIVSEGWIEAPADPRSQSWELNRDFNLGDASVPIIVADVNQDGLADLIVGKAHDYGLDWYEQKSEGNNFVFIKHPIDPFQSQYHTMVWSDIDNDGQEELITGKRYRAHNGNDPGANDPPGLYYFKWNGESFTKNVISYGPPGDGKGAGIFFSVADLNNSGRKDIVVAGKDGLYVFFNE